MKRKTINAIITKKVKQWHESINDESVRKLAESDTIVTGGCIASMLLKESVNDFDIYLKTHETALALAQYYVHEFSKVREAKGINTPISILNENNRIKLVIKSAGIAGKDEGEYDYFENREPEAAQGYVSDIMDDPGDIEDTYQDTESLALQETNNFRPVFLSTNAITLSDKVQIILRFTGTPRIIHENYDFVHCTNYWTKQEGVVLNADAMESLLSKELRYIGSRYPLCSIIRTRKFIKRGWSINAGQMLKMIWQVNGLDLADIKVLEDQLTGVDVAYFFQVINRLKEKGDRVEGAYLIEIIDRMF